MNNTASLHTTADEALGLIRETYRHDTVKMGDAVYRQHQSDYMGWLNKRDIWLIVNALVKDSGGKRIQKAVIERDYVLAWFLTVLGYHPLREILAFKGGAVLRRCWFNGYRFSADMDFTLTEPANLENILAGVNEIYKLTQ